MNVAAANVVGTGLLKGAFDVLDAMLSTSIEFTLEDPVTLDETTATEWLGEFPVSLQGSIKNDLGAIALLLPIPVAAQFAALIQEQDSADKTELSDEDRGVLGEIADPALGGGVTNLMERFGHSVEQLENVAVLDNGPENAGPLMALMGDSPRAVRFTFTDNAAITGAGVAVFAAVLEDMVPEEQLNTGSGAELAAHAELSPEEMSDILSGFGSQGDASEPENDGNGPAAIAASAHGNLDMVLDIGLIATARLGHVEMPISEILSLGPGSIIEVGHLVDEPVDLLVNGKLIARGDVVVVDEKFGLRITEIVSTRARIESLR